MTRYYGHFDDLFMEDCGLGQLSVSGGTLRLLIVRDLMIWQEHPASHDNTRFYVDGFVMVFEGVVRSECKLHVYAGDPENDGFAETKTITHGPFPPYQGPTEVYDLTGVLEDRSAWVESWIIEAGTFFLEEPSGAWQRYGEVQRYRKERPSGSA